MIYVVLEGNRVIENPDGVMGKPAGAAGVVIHVVDAHGTIIGNYPIKLVRYYGQTLPPYWQKMLDDQKAWDSKTPEEKEAILSAKRQKQEHETS